MHRDLGPAPPHPPAIQPPRGRPGEGPMDFAVSSRVPRRGADAARVGSKSILKGRHEGQRRALDWADVCPQGMRTMTKPLVCAGQRASQFPLRPYTYRPDRDFSFIEINQRLRQLHPGIVDEVVRSLEQHGGAVTRDVDTDLLSVNSMLSVSIVIARCHTTPSDAFRWTVRLDVGLDPDLTIAVRMDAPNRAPLDYYVLPSLDVHGARLRIREDNGILLDGYRYESLDYFFGMAQTVRAGVAA